MLVNPIAVGWAKPASQNRERERESWAMGVRNTKGRDSKRGEGKKSEEEERQMNREIKGHRAQ